MKRMMRSNWTAAAALVAALALIVAALWIFAGPPPAAQAASPVMGAVSAKAGSGGVTSGLFVKLSAAGTVIKCSATTDEVVGVCEQTAAANGLTRYAPIGTMTHVTTGEGITAGNLLMTGTGGKAYVYTTGGSPVRCAALALTGSTGADESIACIVLGGVATLSTGGDVSVSGTLTSADTVKPELILATGKTNTGAITVNGKTSGSLVLTTDDSTAYALTVKAAPQTVGVATLSLPDLANVDSTVVVAAGGTDISQNGTITSASAAPILATATGKAATGKVQIPGKTTGSLVLTTADATVYTLTVKAAAQTVGAATLTLPDIKGTATAVLTDAVALEATTGVEPILATPFCLSFAPKNGAGETLTYTVPSGKKLRVIDVRGYKTHGASASASDTVTVKNGATAITDAIGLNIADKVAFAAGTHDDAQRDIAAAGTLNVVTTFNTDCACVVNVRCVWVAP